MLLIFVYFLFNIANAQINNDYDSTPAAPPPALDACNGVFLSYTFTSREKEYPHVKNASAQAWAFKATATIINTGQYRVENWQMHVGFQHQEILVSASGGILVDATDFPVDVSNGTTFAGDSRADLKTSIETAADFSQIAAQIDITGTQFGVKPPGVPMPKDIKLVNDGYKCPAATRQGKTYMHVCCKRDPKLKAKLLKKVKFMPLQYGDLSFTYDVLQAYGNNYLAQVTMDNIHPLGRLDHWNLTWEWQNDEFISSIRGAYARSRDSSQCVYGPAGKYYADFDFSQVVTCDKSPIISDLPQEKANDTKLGKLPYCCRNGTLLPTVMDENKARSIFQLQVYKMPPDLNRTALVPPRKWKIVGVLNPQYKCGNPIRVDPSDFPDRDGLQATSSAVASWQIVCNITRPKEKQSRCCVSFSAYYNESIIPCNTCACGCNDNKQCSATASAMLLPPEALLVPFANRTEKAMAWAKLKHYKVPKPRPCPDNCPVSINWHINTDYKTGWTARITLFNWDDAPFQDWFTAIQMDKAYPGYENIYSFNGTKLDNLNNTIFIQGLTGLNYLMGEVNGTKGNPRVPGKQQSVISFTKKQTPGINIPRGDGFPKRVLFNGEECALPARIPLQSGGNKSHVNLFIVVLISIMSLVLMKDLCW
ncbi:Protein COBRA precursor, putative [Ricinus communis]|uniref:Protein COBRA, putative n=2 Tax=Ricinus communis TaxID=3988 RepID=B9SA42_RICCO|nr:Protein COBRA precursor, putative [Ricinus communis]